MCVCGCVCVREMGSCWPKPVNNLQSSKFSNAAAQTTVDSKKPENNNNNNNHLNNKTESKSIIEENWPLPEPEDGGGAVQEIPSSGKIVTPNLKMFLFADLKSATRNFRPDTMVGEGGFGRVFKGWVDPKTLAPSKVGVGVPVAVKKSNPDSAQGLKEWQAEVKFLGKFSHPNLVKLLGYCWEDKIFLLVYEYMQKGSLENHLFRRAEPLPWGTRIKIVIGAARGLEFLHNTEKKVIYRDFKSANILLDGEFNAKLSDFGLAKVGPANGESHVSTGIVGTYGYAAPEYMATGHLYVKSDVYGFGVVLLEIITGLRVLDMNRPNGEHNLVDWARPYLSDRRKLKRIMDPNLEHSYPSKGAVRAAELIQRCLESDPKNRPSMEEVLLDLEQINAIKTKPKEARTNSRQSTGHNNEQKSKSYGYQNQQRTPPHGEGARFNLRSPNRSY